VGVLLLLFSALLAAAFGIGVAGSARVRDSAGFCVAVLVGAAAQLVLITELLSLLSFWRPGALIGAQLLSLPALWFVHRRVGGELPLANLRAAASRLHPQAVIATAKREPIAAAVLTVGTLLLMAELIAAIAIAPNTWDSMTYHLARIVYWMQNDSVMQFANASERQAAFPINTEVLQGWTMMLSGGDRFVQTIQWTAQLGVIAFVVAAGKDLGFRLRDRSMAAAAFLAMPIAVAESSSSQNDMAMAFLAAAALLFLVRGLRGEKGALALMAIAVGLMVGMKSNTVLMLAALGAAAVISAGRDLRSLFRPALYIAIATLLLGFLNYGQNLVERGSLIGTDVGSSFLLKSPRDIPANATRVAWYWNASIPRMNNSDLRGFVEDEIGRPIWRLAQKLSGRPDDHSGLVLGLNTFTREDRVAGGLPLLLLILPAVFLSLARPQTREQLAYAATAVAAFVLTILVLKFNSWIGRFVLAPAAFGAPLVARIVQVRTMHLLVLLLVAMSFSTMGLRANMKSLIDLEHTPVVERSRLQQQTAADPTEAATIEMVNRHVAADARIGLAAYEESWDYPLAGAHFGRTLVRLPLGALPADAFERYDLDALLITNPKLLDQVTFKPTYRTSDAELVLRSGGK
jgi:hypothetical protein